MRVGKNTSDLFSKWFLKIYEDHFEGLFRYAYAITKNEHLAEDVVSEVFANLWENRPDHHSIKEVSAYLKVSVKHLAIRTLSKEAKKFSGATYSESQEVADSISPEDLLLSSEMNNLINTTIGQLPPQTKLVYEMSRIKGLNNEEIAKELDISKRTVETHLHNSLKLIRTCLQNHYANSSTKMIAIIRTILVFISISVLLFF